MDIEDLIPFAFEYPKWKERGSQRGMPGQLFADQAEL